MDKNSEDGDVDGDFTNNTIDLDEDYDAIYDWNDVDDDNDGIWDFFEIDTNDDLDDDADQDYGTAFFVGANCDDRDDDGNDQDVDGDGWFNVWDKGEMTQGLKTRGSMTSIMTTTVCRIQKILMTITMASGHAFKSCYRDVSR